MSDWVHCNQCGKRPATEVDLATFKVTNCGHILCSSCFIESEACAVCQHKNVKAHFIDDNMPANVAKFFLRPEAFAAGMRTRYENAVAFQHAQKILMERRLVRKIVLLWRQVRVDKKHSHEKEQLEKEIASLRELLKNMKEQLQYIQKYHQEFEERALQWGRRTFSSGGSGECYSKERDTTQSGIKLAAGGGNAQAKTTEAVPNDSTLSTASGESVSQRSNVAAPDAAPGCSNAAENANQEQVNCAQLPARNAGAVRLPPRSTGHTVRIFDTTEVAVEIEMPRVRDDNSGPSGQN